MELKFNNMGIAFLVPQANYRDSYLGQVTPGNTEPILALAIDGPSSVLNKAKFYPLYLPTFTNQRGVAWSIESGSDYAEISSDGTLLVKSTATTDQNVTIKCTSAVDSTIYAIKNITVKSVVIQIYDYLDSDGTGYIVLPGYLDLTDAVVTVKGYITKSNGYLSGGLYSTNAGQAAWGVYKQSSSGKLAFRIGSLNYVASTVAASTTPLSYVFHLSTEQTSSDAFVEVKNENTVLWTSSRGVMRVSGIMGIHCYPAGAPGSSWNPGSSPNINIGRFYGMHIEKNDKTVIANFVPCTVNGVPAVIDTISGELFYNGAASGLTVGND